MDATSSSFPAADELRIGFIGAGRLGKALAWSLSRAGLHVSAVASGSQVNARALAEPIPGCVTADAQSVVDRCDLVFVTTPDGAITTTTAGLRWRPGMAVVHCSGVTEVSALASAHRDGALVGGFHPMQTFGDPVVAMASLPGSTITVEASEPLMSALEALTQRLGCRVNRLPPGMRGCYHAAAGYTSQFINALFGEATKIWRSWGATDEDALKALMPLAQGTLASIASAGIAGGMPGPVSRGDVSSVEKHVAALSQLGAGTLRFYCQMCASTVPLALAHGAIDAEVATRILTALGAAQESAFAHGDASFIASRAVVLPPTSATLHEPAERAIQGKPT